MEPYSLKLAAKISALATISRYLFHAVVGSSVLSIIALLIDTRFAIGVFVCSVLLQAIEAKIANTIINLVIELSDEMIYELNRKQ